MTRPRRGLLVALLVAGTGLTLCATRAHSQATPGNPAGSQTGDSGGAYSGLASSPEANLFTGVAQTSIPIEVPPGRLGLAPVLALSYSSSAGASPYGDGWTLPLPRVHRSTRRGLPGYDDGDTFVLEMPGSMIELERIPGSPHGYRAQIESSYLRIGFDGRSNFWKVIDKLGVTFVFGASPATRAGRGPARDETFAWLLESIEDPAGNRIDFSYRQGGAGGTSSGLPDVIRYGANARTGAGAFAAVTFTWAPLAHAGPPRMSWRDGYADVLDVRLAAIDTSTHGLAARRYDFSHEEDPVTADLRLVGATLTAFAENPGDDVQLPSTVFVYAPALHEGWPALATTVTGPELVEVPAAGYLHYGKNAITLDSVDLNGDAVVDRINTNMRPPQVLLGNRHGFEASRSWNWPATTGAPRVVRRTDDDGNLESNVFDLDGDGFADLVDSDPASCGATIHFWCVWRGGADGFATTPLQWFSPVELLRTTRSGGARTVTDLVDMDADGRLDLVDASGYDEASGVRYWNVHRNTGTGFSPVAVHFAAPLSCLARNSGTRLIHGLFDINADSLPDLVVADPDSPDSMVWWGGYPAWQVYLNDGRGFPSEPTLWPIDGGVGDGTGLPNFLSLHAGDGTMIADLFDITGDGRPDLVRRSHGVEPLFSGVPRLCLPQSRCVYPDEDDSAESRGFCCFNLIVFVNTGSSFSQPVGWSSPAHGLRANRTSCPDIDTGNCIGVVYDFDFFDFDGDGLVDFVERYTAAGRLGEWLVHLHPAAAAAGGARPNLLLAMRNGVGGETMLHYDVAAATPATRLPFPHWIVTERELRDSVFDQAPLRTSFAYRGGFFDVADREFRGFSVVQETDSVGTIRVREYHQDRRRAGRLRRLTNLAPPPCVAADPEDPSDPCSPWRFRLGLTDYEWPDQGPVLLRRETDVPYHDGVPVENLRRTSDYEYDSYGSVARRRTQTPMARGTTTTTSYVYRVADGPGGMPASYLVAKPGHVRTDEDGRASPLVEKTFEYEWGAPAPASLSVASICMSWDDGGCAHWSQRSFEYDSFGNMIVARAPDGATSRTGYDADGLFAVRSVDPVGLQTTSTTEPRSGLVIETVAPNGNRLRSRFDGLGRLVRTWGPGTSKQAPLRRLEYAPGSLGPSPPRVVVTDAASGTAATFYDGLGRTVATKVSSSNDGTEVCLVSGLKRYDERGLVIAEALPFDSTSLDTAVLTERFEDAPAWMELAYDQAGRLTETRAPDGSTTRVDRSAPGILRTDDANTAGTQYPGSVTLEFFDGLGHRILKESCSAAPQPLSPYECPPGSLVRRESWTWDGLGRIEELRTGSLGVAAGDSVTRIQRDGLGNRTVVFHSNAGTWHFGNDDNGRVIEVVKPDGVRLATTYDASGRILRRRGPTSSATYRYASAGGGAGKVVRATARSRRARISEDFAYDDRGRVAARHRRIAVRGQPPAELTTVYSYDDFDRRIATEYLGWEAEGEDIVYTDYDTHGREVGVWTEARTYVVGAGYDSAGRLLRADYGNGLSDLTAYEPRSNALGSAGYLRCTRTTATAAASAGACTTEAADLDGLRYDTYDPAGNLIAVSDPLHPAGDSLQDSRRYEYDAIGRLAGVAYGSRPSEPFAFDPLGNLTRKDSRTLEYHDDEHPSRITAIRDATGPPGTVEYDPNGRRIRDGEKFFSYDDSDHLAEVAVAGGVVSRYGYNDAGERVYSQDLARGTVEFELGDGVRVDADGIERAIAFAGRPVAVERRARVPDGIRSRTRAARDVSDAETIRLFLHHDYQGSARTVTDDSGRVVEQSRYAPFGERRVLLDGRGRPVDDPSTRFAYSGHVEDRASQLLFFGARHYDPATGSFLTLDPAMQFASPYAYSAGNPVIGRDADGSVFELTAIELLELVVGTATFVDSIVRTGDLGHSLTAGIFAGFSVYFSSQLSTALARPLARSGHVWLQMAASVASDGFQGIEAAEAIEDGRYAGGVVAAGMLAASLIGIETANDPGAGTTPAETQERHGIKDRGMIDGKHVIDVNGICSTRPGCFTNILVAARENLKVLFGGQAACVGGCEQVAAVAEKNLGQGHDVLLRCNSFGAIKCLGAIQQQGLASRLEPGSPAGSPRLTVEMSGAPLLRPPKINNLTYQVNLFDPVVWVGAGYSTPFRSDVVLGRNWWVPVPLLVHHSRMYEKPFHEALGDMLP